MEVTLSYGGVQKGLPLIAATTKVGNKFLKGIGLDEETALRALEDEVAKETFRLGTKASLPRKVFVDWDDPKVGGTD